jgi:outer membrane protein assembly factor BamA
VEIGNRLRDAAFELRFLNQAHRWNWGFVAELEPSRRRYRRSESVQYDGQSALFKQADDLQRVQLAAAGVLAYPFNRGLRVELTAGVRQASYQRELRSQISSAETGRVLEEATVRTPGGAPTTMAEFGAALVGDTSVFGPTGPLLGSRYRFEVTPGVGELSYVRVLADYRRYVMPVRPYALAVRLLHAGRYGRDADDPRLLSTFIGSRYFVRGHGLDAQRCQPAPDRACGEELIGNRLAVANLELRFPLWGALSRQLEYGPVPADVFAFADGGLVWPSRAGLDAVSRRRSVISSVGAGVRVNAGGLPFEFVAVRALDGPRPEWTFDYGFRLGF